MKKIIFILFTLVIVVALGWFIYKDFSKTKNEPMMEAGLPSLEAEESENEISGLKEKIPDLDRKINVKAKFSLEQRQRLLSDISEVRERLKEDYDVLQDWLQLGLLYKALEDYEGAKDAWEFATLI